MSLFSHVKERVEDLFGGVILAERVFKGDEESVLAINPLKARLPANVVKTGLREANFAAREVAALAIDVHAKGDLL